MLSLAAMTAGPVPNGARSERLDCSVTPQPLAVCIGLNWPVCWRESPSRFEERLERRRSHLLNTQLPECMNAAKNHCVADARHSGEVCAVYERGGYDCGSPAVMGAANSAALRWPV